MERKSKQNKSPFKLKKSSLHEVKTSPTKYMPGMRGRWSTRRDDYVVGSGGDIIDKSTMRVGRGFGGGRSQPGAKTAGLTEFSTYTPPYSSYRPSGMFGLFYG